MADIRINSLPTTASASSSDDFLALDGATNGTRKLNAYSPTFGGNVTASGNLTLSGATSTITLGSTNTGSIAVDANGALIVTPKAGQATTLSVSGNSGLSVNNGATQIYLGNSGGNAVAGTLNANDFLLIRDGAVKLTATATGVDIGGNLTVSGTGTSSVAGSLGIGTTTPNRSLTVNGIVGVTNGTANTQQLVFNIAGNGAYITSSYIGSSAYVPLHLEAGGSIRATILTNGNILIGTNTDAGQKFQVDGTAYVSGDATFAGKVTINANNSGSAINGTFRLNGGGSSGANNILDDILWGAQGLSWLRIYGTRDAGGGYGGTQYFQTMNGSGTLTTALTLDSSQNATFAGTVTAGTWASGNADKLKVSTSANAYAAYIVNTAASGGSYGIRLHTDATAATDLLLVATSGSGGGSTRFTVKANGTLNAPSLPTSSSGLSTGDIWNDGGTLKIV